MIKLDKTTAIPFNNSFLIPIKADIRKLFGTNKVEFQISIIDEKIVIESPKILASRDFQDRQRVKEAINVI
jgi:hypothetical protein